MHSGARHDENATGAMCGYCGGLFTPTRLWERFCSTDCRNGYDKDIGATGTVASVRRIKRGVSVVVHLPEGPAAERALKLELKHVVRIVRQ